MASSLGQRLSTRPVLRPTTGKVKAALFNILDHAPFSFENRSVLDLFCGTGQLGLEAIERGAARVLFVDHAFLHIKPLRSKLSELANPRYEVLCLGVFEVLDQIQARGEAFDLIFLDPPYREDWINATLDRIVQKKIVRRGGWIVCEHDRREPIQLVFDGFTKDSRRYGDTVLTLLKNA